MSLRQLSEIITDFCLEYGEKLTKAEFLERYTTFSPPPPRPPPPKPKKFTRPRLCPACHFYDCDRASTCAGRGGSAKYCQCHVVDGPYYRHPDQPKRSTMVMFRNELKMRDSVERQEASSVEGQESSTVEGQKASTVERQEASTVV